jgi:hypothetical protein
VIERTSFSCREWQQMSKNLLRGNIATMKRKLGTGIDVPIGRNVAGRVPDVARLPVPGRLIRAFRGRPFRASNLVERGVSDYIIVDWIDRESAAMTSGVTTIPEVREGSNVEFAPFVVEAVLVS